MPDVAHRLEVKCKSVPGQIVESNSEVGVGKLDIYKAKGQVHKTWDVLDDRLCNRQLLHHLTLDLQNCTKEEKDGEAWVSAVPHRTHDESPESR